MSLVSSTLDREVSLVRVGVFKVLLHVQREGKYWTKARERLIVESLATKLILRARGNTRRHDACQDRSASLVHPEDKQFPGKPAPH